jgi:excisionase family DNA binding protein
MKLYPDVADVLGIGRAAVYEAARRGEIPTLSFGRRLVVPTAALRRMLALEQDGQS